MAIVISKSNPLGVITPGVEMNLVRRVVGVLCLGILALFPLSLAGLFVSWIGRLLTMPTSQAPAPIPPKP
jgi:hypothetical protein